MFGKKKTVAAAAEVPQHDKAILYIERFIITMPKSANYDMGYGMLCFAYDLGIINAEERQALADKMRTRAAELREEEKAQKEKEKEEKARVIAEYEAARREKAKAAKAKMAEGKK